MGIEGKSVQSLTCPDLIDFCHGFLSFFFWILVGEAAHRQGKETS